MGYRASGSYVIRAGCSSSTPNDSTTYYFGKIETLTLTVGANQNRIYIPRTGVIRAVCTEWRNSNDASEEDTSIYIRLNDTTDYLVYTGTVGISTLYNYMNNYAMSIPVSKGDFIEIKIITPAWATNPTGTIVICDIDIETV